MTYSDDYRGEVVEDVVVGGKKQYLLQRLEHMKRIQHRDYVECQI